MNDEIKTKAWPEYDIPTAVTFLIAGLGIGSVIALLFSERAKPHSSPLTSAVPRPSLP